jgi:predicted transposase/invertase (TIGR01784 family)
VKTRSLISFDWAIKRLLRSKANYEVLEGFLSELLRRNIIIKHIGESEGNKTDAKDRSNRVDILVEADGQEIFIIELQYDSEDDYFQRMVYSASKTITERIEEGDHYSKVCKIYSVNIVYFDLGTGKDYIYHGINQFTGIHKHDSLHLNARQKKLYGKTYPGELHPEYYIIKVKNFDDVAKDTLDEWIYYLKNNVIKDGFTAKGLKKARKILDFNKLNDEEKQAYWRHIEDRRVRESEIKTSFGEGMDAGEAIGLEKGKAEGEARALECVVIESRQAGFSLEQIQLITKLTIEQITEILKQQ